MYPTGVHKVTARWKKCIEQLTDEDAKERRLVGAKVKRGEVKRGEINVEEMKRARKINSGKAAGPDNIPGEVYIIYKQWKCSYCSTSL